MSKVWEFIQQFEGRQREVMVYFHHLLTMELNLEEKIRFGIPFYFGRSWICYLNPIKNQKVELAFVRGNELSNIQGLLDNKGRKQVCSIEFEKVSDIPESIIHEIIQEAILLDETTAYESKRRGGKK
jgi:filamentous hemagglutinin family protein